MSLVKLMVLKLSGSIKINLKISHTRLRLRQLALPSPFAHRARITLCGLCDLSQMWISLLFHCCAFNINPTCRNLSKTKFTSHVTRLGALEWAKCRICLDSDLHTVPCVWCVACTLRLSWGKYFLPELQPPHAEGRFEPQRIWNSSLVCFINLLLESHASICWA